MATLTVENLPDALYAQLERRALQRQHSIAQEVAGILSAALDTAAPASILELEGLGKELWQGIDPAAHVAAERAAWD